MANENSNKLVRFLIGIVVGAVLLALECGIVMLVDKLTASGKMKFLQYVVVVVFLALFYTPAKSFLNKASRYPVLSIINVLFNIPSVGWIIRFILTILTAFVIGPFIVGIRITKSSN